jgi:hypothetical protein
VKLAIFHDFGLPSVHVAPKKGPPFLDTRARMGRVNSGTEGFAFLERIQSGKEMLARMAGLGRFKRERANPGRNKQERIPVCKVMPATSGSNTKKGVLPTLSYEKTLFGLHLRK